MTKVVINEIDEFVLTKDKELELRQWLEENSDIIIENTHEQLESNDDEFIIEFEPETSIIYNKGDIERDEE